jgi:two-component system cell cycle response regulator DivK
MVAPDRSDLTVLVIEDNLDNRLVLREFLKHRCGVRHCLEASAGWQAFKQLGTQPASHPVDLILLDLQIPGEDGYAVLTRIRGTPTLQTTPVIAVTASVGAKDVERCRAAGFDGFIGKPINATRFPEQIRRILRGDSVWEPS